MPRVWIEDRATHEDYQESMEKWQAAKKQGSKRQPPGRWRVRWYGPDGKGKAKTCRTVPQAEAEQQALLQKLDKGSYRDPQSAKAAVRLVADEWHKSLRKQGRRTKDDYRELLDLYVIPKWGDWQVGAIQWADVSEWVNDLCSTPGKAGRMLSPSRIAKIYYVLSGVMKHAVRTHRISMSPLHDHDLPRSDDDDDHVYLTHEQLETLAERAGRYQTFVRTLGYTGIRWGEAIAIKVGRTMLDDRRIRIIQAYSDIDGHLELGPVKNHEKRSVPLPRSFAEELRPLVVGRTRDALVFTAPEGGPMRYPNFRRRDFDKAVKEAGLDGMKVTPHKLRHTAASLAIAAGADVKVVQTMLGHKSAAMTLDVYGHLWPDRLDEVADALDVGRATALAKLKASLVIVD
ncbi:tyrosine-type recombinase/integrase [Streptomyces phaeochromogenes]|uniref:tyrosine-type recombinase/integrase n=1 Tax=Streptomyces phaeochromogenes TaxID=1923 RepID=UPI00099F251F|nr:site-specific integrase [Streptomyces phaeochromogenes]